MRRPQRDDKFYIPLSTAAEMTGANASAIYYHYCHGNIRGRILRRSDGRRVLVVHVDDVAHFGYPRLRDLAEVTGRSRESIATLVKSRHLPGLSRFGHVYRIRPDWFPRIVKWIRAGAPVRPPFLPKEVS